MAYRRQRNIYDGGYYSAIPTTVNIYWSTKSSAYAIKFEDTHHWNEMQIFIKYLNSIPYGERDYDAENKIWYLMEQHIVGFKKMMEMIPEHFKINFTEKPANEQFKGKFVSVDTYLDRFKNISGFDIRNQDYLDAKKVYRRCALANHPDRGGDAKKMSELNEAWTEIERLHFNIKKETDYVST
jgi:hypothetical protein